MHFTWTNIKPTGSRDLFVSHIFCSQKGYNFRGHPELFLPSLQLVVYYRPLPARMKGRHAKSLDLGQEGQEGQEGQDG